MAARLEWHWRRRGERAATACDPGCIDELAEILDGLPWVLGGGLAIPFTLGTFHRQHDDVDLLFDDAAFPAIEAAFARAGYSLWQHYTMSLFGALRGAWHLRLNEHSLPARMRRRKLKFRRDDVQQARRLRCVDALPFRIFGSVLHTCDGRHHIAMQAPIVGHVARSSGGHAIPCLHLSYVAQLKGPRRDPKDLIDFARIRDVGLLPAGDWGV
ncbi:MAG: hypothetical protein KF689_12260 [Gemmatimonadaceae bacterium]|nr:hypothetical protein [Gemmatimonadaceae bacterium]MCW5827246.1 hypothetical protein [Gemmatimonadaceae bacterium]